ncbi:MAG: hypothetical protein C4547_05640 [Phycisphaerales bacterium]|nr:MAG: hypothetical protein C4547_05640 [Phycisphaerales bacterium]
MSQWKMLGGMVVCLTAAGAAYAGYVDPELARVLKDTAPDEAVSTFVVMADQVDVPALSRHLTRIQADRHLRHKIVVSRLMEKAAATQGGLLHYLEGQQQAGHVKFYEGYWITNLVQVVAVPSVIEAIAERDDVEVVYEDVPVETILPVEIEGPQPPSPIAAPEPGIRIIGADRVWNELGIRGEGALVSHLDTGADGNHPAYNSRWRGLDPRYENHPEWAFFDPITNRTFPFDAGSHGTHTMGTITGNAPNAEIGVAPEAEWITAAVIDRNPDPERTTYIAALQWTADPDGNPETSFDVPDVCSNSWGTRVHAPCAQNFWAAIDNSEAAGVVQVFAAGNEGQSGLRRPGDRATDEYRTFAVAACDGNNPDCPIASFSSRGPTTCTPDGRPAIKPEIAGPGVNVRSSLPGGAYGNLSGTSMSTPHLAGVAALMRSGNPELGVEEIKQLMMDTATDKGEPGNDNSFGWGLVNAYEAVVAGLNDPEPAACCFRDGSCENLMRTDCVDRGGRSQFGETCETFNCPQPGACCVNNFTCEIMLERDCISQGGEFMGEGVGCELICPCDVIKKMKGNCKGSGTLKGIVKFRNTSWDGRTVKFQVGDRLRFDVTVHGKKATLFTCCFDGPQTVRLIDPDGCLEPIIVNCP